jgi:O-antigen ligase
MLALTVGLLPTLMLLRVFFVFSLLTAVLAGTILFCAAVLPREFARLRNNRLLFVFLIAATVYWWISFLVTRQYSSNLRVLELAFSATAVFLLAGHRAALRIAFLGLSISLFAEALGLSPYGERLGITEVGDTSIGNPIQFGLAATLILFLGTADNGRWLHAGPAWFVRSGLSLGALVCLIQSTSRGSWLVALGGFTLLVLFVKEQRKPVLAAALVGAGVIAGLVASGRADAAVKYFKKATAEERTLSQKTTGRFDQWAAIPRVMDDAPFFGHGPGTGREVVERYVGVSLMWHSLYLQIAAESGLFGLALLACFLFALLRQAILYWRRTNEFVPLLALFSFCLIGVSVSGGDALSGAYLGLALAGTETLPAIYRSTRRTLVLKPDQPTRVTIAGRAPIRIA